MKNVMDNDYPECPIFFTVSAYQKPNMVFLRVCHLLVNFLSIAYDVRMKYD